MVQHEGVEEVAENGEQGLQSVAGEAQNGRSGDWNAVQKNPIRNRAEELERSDRVRGRSERVDGLSETESSGYKNGDSERIASNDARVRSEHRNVDKSEGNVQLDDIAEKKETNRLRFAEGETRNGESSDGNAEQKKHFQENTGDTERLDRIRGGREQNDGLSETESSGFGNGDYGRNVSDGMGVRPEHRNVDNAEGTVQRERVTENSDRASGTDNLPKFFLQDENGEIRFKQLDIDYADGTMRKDRFNIRYKQDVKAVDGYICGEYGVNKEDVTGLYNVTELRSGMKIQGFKTVAETKKAAQYLNEHATLEDVTFYRGMSGDMYYIKQTPEFKEYAEKVKAILTQKEYNNDSVSVTEIHDGKVPFNTKSALAEYVKAHKGENVRVTFNNGKSEIRTLESATSAVLRTKKQDGTVSSAGLKGAKFNDTGFSIVYDTGVSVDFDFVNAAENTVKNSSDTESNAPKLTEKCDLITTKHTKTGDDLWVVTLGEKISSDAYADLNKKVKAVGGYYSRFAKAADGSPAPGFVFKSEPSEEVIKVFNDFFEPTRFGTDSHEGANKDADR